MKDIRVYVKLFTEQNILVPDLKGFVVQGL